MQMKSDIDILDVSNSGMMGLDIFESSAVKNNRIEFSCTIS